MRVRVEVSLRGMLDVEVPEARVEAVRSLVKSSVVESSMGLEEFEELSGTTVDWDDVYASAPVVVKVVHVPVATGPGNDIHPRLMRPTIESIARTVATYYGLKLADLRGRGRVPSVALPRMVVMYLARELTRKSFPEIGRGLGGRDHSTVVHGVRKVGKLLLENSPLRRAVDLIRSSVLAGEAREVPS